MSGTTPNSSKAERRALLKVAAKGASIGMLAAVVTTCIEWGLLGNWSVEAAPTVWDRILVPVSLAAFLLPIGAIAGVAWSLTIHVARRYASTPTARWTIIIGSGALVLMAIGAVALFAPALAKQAGALTVVLGAGWMAIFAVLTLATQDSKRGRWLLSRTAIVLIPFALWAMLFAAVRWDGAQMARAMTLETAPLSGVLARSALHLADTDNDGNASLFAGGDCAEGNPAIRPGAPEIAGNGIDEDCDGEDLPASTVFRAAAGRVEHARSAGWRKAETVAIEHPPIPFAKAPIVIVTLDTVRPDFTGVGGADPSPTPSLDRFAETAVLFQKAYAQGPLTKASIGSMMTGKYFSEVRRSPDQWPVIHKEETLLAEGMQTAGYRTTAITSHPYLTARFGYGQGFEKMENFPPKPGRGWFWTADRVVTAAIAEMKRLEDERFFLWVHILDPHHPYLLHPSVVAKNNTQKERYRAELKWTDWQLGRLLKAIPKDAVVVIQSDHGEGFGEHGYSFHGQQLYEDQIRVVLVVRAPGAKVGVRPRPVMLLDLYPTLLAIARGTPLAEQVPTQDFGLGDPISLVPTLIGARLPSRPVFTEMVPDNKLSSRKGVVQGQWKLLRSITYNTWQLFDLKNDPGEQTNLINENKEQLAKMRTLLDRFTTEGLTEQRPVAP